MIAQAQRELDQLRAETHQYMIMNDYQDAQGTRATAMYILHVTLEPANANVIYTIIDGGFVTTTTDYIRARDTLANILEANVNYNPPPRTHRSAPSLPNIDDLLVEVYS